MFDRVEAECLLCPSCRGYSKDSGKDWTKKKKNEKNPIKASTDDIDIIFRNYATITNDTAAAKLETASDVHPMDAFYHKSCSRYFYHRLRSHSRHDLSPKLKKHSTYLETMDFAQFVAYLGEGWMKFRIDN